MTNIFFDSTKEFSNFGFTKYKIVLIDWFSNKNYIVKIDKPQGLDSNSLKNIIIFVKNHMPRSMD